ncbi:MAG: Na+/proline symporter [Dehalococcoidia bacterium]
MSVQAWALPITVVTSLLFLLLGVLYVRRRRLNVEEYIVARNSAGSMLATATLVASVIGAWILFSPAETGTWAGMVALIGYGVGQAAPLLAFIVLGLRMRRLMPEGHSLTEYVWHRYGSAMYVFSLGVIVFYMFIFLTAELTGIALAIHLLSQTPLWLTALIVGLVTVAYTAYGGIRASIFTDSVQFTFILPLLLISFFVAVVALGGFGTAFGSVTQQAPQLLSLTHGPGIEFGVTLIIAILAANMFHQGFWQRVYTCRDEKALRWGFASAGLLVIPVVFVAGLLGVMAVGLGVVDEPSVALFALILEVVPTWAVLVVLVLALVLVMSSLDTLLNGIASAVTSDLARFKPGIQGVHLLRSSRVITVVLVVPAIFIASQGYSVLYLFLIADLVCAAAVFPVFFGLYSRWLSGRAALVSSVAGLIVGALFFPTPDFTPWVPIPLAGRFVVSFGTALGASAIMSVLLSALSSRLRIVPEYDFAHLREQVHLIQG